MPGPEAGAPDAEGSDMENERANNVTKKHWPWPYNTYSQGGCEYAYKLTIHNTGIPVYSLFTPVPSSHIVQSLTNITFHRISSLEFGVKFHFSAVSVASED